ncbi:54S ribosomal protein L25, mitochondrial [Colletotrichum tanaceti]|uniref:54S ribosomal protein L25, mitochondrial n=1 Tax=Colletotrichum tanaceti TaxID=1306861 RepID=A0A4U6XTL8_9PEZI|nr:54S ribosomal protein L25, mitochondrial [Colletotrichum tanaceti]TKW59307.1 54S ribosomal protein L25, mitochondrial [Colletotrichum tanaceti]
MAATEQYIQLAKALPKQLQRFFARWPPALIVPAFTKRTGFQGITPNPFSWQRHPVTGKLHNPVYSLRRQAEIVKLARQHGVEELLPTTVKGTDYRIARRVEHGLRVKGTGVGQKVKGKIHERMVQPRMEKRREAILAMPKLIKEWKKVGRRNWTNFPK